MLFIDDARCPLHVGDLSEADPEAGAISRRDSPSARLVEDRAAHFRVDHAGAALASVPAVVGARGILVGGV
ncbi:hypothetical protein F4561_006365 [Lipingzhangella halophila]|uniref:Uncharacterized protein n=1 Tax=Lipingzhangella halophila TaxID=1783352 RepID=A0A7W7RQ17_9ACTN|nr:hypothetical protein [Lipingzhangella halophila]MBB4935471.1 hypothetical protein [Lipingzhangella halophila]